MKRRTRSIFLAGIFIFLIIFLFRSTPEGEVVSVTSQSNSLVSVKPNIPSLTQRVIIGVPEELQSYGIFYAGEGGDVVIITFTDPLNPIAHWEHNWDPILNWDSETCLLTMVGDHGIYTSTLSGNEINFLLYYEDLNLPDQGLFFPSPNLEEAVFSHSISDCWALGSMNWYCENEDLSYISINDPLLIRPVTTNHGAGIQYYNWATLFSFVSWSPDSRYIAYIDRDVNEIHQVYLLDTQSGNRTQITAFMEPRPEYQMLNIRRVEFSPEGSYLLVEYEEYSSEPGLNTSWILWDMVNNEVIENLSFYNIEWGNDSTLFLQNSNDQTLSLYNIRDNSTEIIFDSSFFNNEYIIHWIHPVESSAFILALLHNRFGYGRDLYAIDILSGAVFLIPDTQLSLPDANLFIDILENPTGNTCFSNP